LNNNKRLMRTHDIYILYYINNDRYMQCMMRYAPTVHRAVQYNITHRRGQQVGLVGVLGCTGPHGLHVQLIVQGPPVAYHRDRIGRREAASPAGRRGRLSAGLVRPHPAG